MAEVIEKEVCLWEGFCKKLGNYEGKVGGWVDECQATDFIVFSQGVRQAASLVIGPVD